MQSAGAPDPRLIFDGVEDIVDRFLNGMRSGFTALPLLDSSAHLGGFVDSGSVVAWILSREELCLRLLDIGFLFGRVTGGSPNRLFNLHVLLCSDKDASHLGDIIFHQMLVK